MFTSIRRLNERLDRIENEDRDPDGNGQAGIWVYINNHEEILGDIFERLNKLERIKENQNGK